MTNFVPSNNALDWGTVPTLTMRPNLATADIQSTDVIVGTRVYVLEDSTEYVCTDATVGAAVWSANAGGTASSTAYTPSDSGDWQGSVPATVAAALDTLADTSRRMILGAGQETSSASQTDNVINLGGATALPQVRAGSITGFRVTLDTAPTVANIAVSVYKSGSAVAATTLTFVPAGATTQVVTLDVGVSTFLATDTLSLGYTSGAIGNTPIITAIVEISN